MSYYIDRPTRRWPIVLALLALLALAWPAYITYNRAHAGAMVTSYLITPVVVDGKAVVDAQGKPLRRIDFLEAQIQAMIRQNEKPK